MDDPIDVLATLFAEEGSRDYFGEPVSQAVHMLQTAAHARRAGASPALVAAALLHDVGHFLGPVSGNDLMKEIDSAGKKIAFWIGSECAADRPRPIGKENDSARHRSSERA